MGIQLASIRCSGLFAFFLASCWVLHSFFSPINKRQDRFGTSRCEEAGVESRHVPHNFLSSVIEPIVYYSVPYRRNESFLLD